jgi:signal transduction histidine kinase/HPt (histidine-containing phosphotransfer) domain-containing protein
MEITSEHFNRLFPFHLLLNYELKVIGVGSVLGRILSPSSIVGEALSVLFDVKQPKLVVSYQNLADNANQLMILESRQISLQLKCQICILSERTNVLIVATPWVDKLEALEKIGVRANDFPYQDSLVDYLYLIKAHNDALTESRRLNEVLTQQSQALRTATQKLSVLNHELEAARHAAETANRAKDSFLATMSHEIRTPMNAIVGMARLLEESSLDSLEQNYIDIINTSSDSLLTIIDDILDFSKIESGAMTLDRQRFDLFHCIEQATRLMGTKVCDKDLEIILDPELSLPRAVIGDITRLRQILWNLLSNAIKFTATGEIVVSVSAGTTQGSEDGPSVCRFNFEVRDNGIGIPLEQIPYLFEPFRQADPSMARRFGGTGLGLAITRRLCELMGGSINVTSTEGEGTTFQFNLILELVPASQLSGREPHNKISEGPIETIVLLVKNGTLRKTLARQLANLGYAVLTPELTVQQGWEDCECLPLGADQRTVVVVDQRLLSTMPASDQVPIPTHTDLRQFPWIVIAYSHERINPALFTGRRPMVVHKPVGLDQLRSALSQQWEEFDQGLQPSQCEPNPVDPRPYKTGVNDGTEKLADRLPLRILVVDDIAVNRLLSHKLLEKLGYQADEVASGAEAVKLIESDTYDVVFMDIEMPTMDGYAATQQIRRLPSAIQQPWIIAMTAHVSAEDRQRCREIGMDDFLAKPIVPAKLKEALEHFRPHLTPKMGGDEASAMGPEPAEKAGSGTAEPIDAATWDELNQLLGAESAEILAELIDMYLQDALLQVSSIVMAHQFKDASGMIAATHSLRSPSASLGANTLASLCADVEESIRSDPNRWPEQQVDELLIEAGRVSEALRLRHPNQT